MGREVTGTDFRSRVVKFILTMTALRNGWGNDAVTGRVMACTNIHSMMKGGKLSMILK